MALRPRATREAEGTETGLTTADDTFLVDECTLYESFIVMITCCFLGQM